MRRMRTYTRCGYCQPRRSPPTSTWPMPRITAAGLTEEARGRRDEIMQEAQQYSDRLLEDAHAKAREAAVSALNVTARRSPAKSSGPRRRNWRICAPIVTSTGRTCAYTEGILRGIEEWERKEQPHLPKQHKLRRLTGRGGGPAAGARAIDSHAYLRH